jgi:hypothetical protein
VGSIDESDWTAFRQAQDTSLCRLIDGGASVGLPDELIDLCLEEEVLIEAHAL